MSAVPVSAEKLHELERFLYKEASFLDRPDLDSWIDLYTDDGTKAVVPVLEGGARIEADAVVFNG